MNDLNVTRKGISSCPLANIFFMRHNMSVQAAILFVRFHDNKAKPYATSF